MPTAGKRLICMHIDQYLKRIHYSNNLSVEEETLARLHEHHVRYVPFENVDVYFKKAIDLKLDCLYNKVVMNNRGGFCYELNYLFCELLNQIGFTSRIIAARILDDQGNVGPLYDHLAVCVEMGKSFLVDVGFGDLFIKPIEIRAGVYYDGRNYFRVEKLTEDSFLLAMSSDQTEFTNKYIFSLSTVKISDFEQICLDKQINPASYFVKHLVCTKPTDLGRLTVFNDKLIEKRGGQKFEKLLANEREVRAVLKSLFGLDLDENQND